jgi:hypothetical protein
MKTTIFLIVIFFLIIGTSWTIFPQPVKIIEPVTVLVSGVEEYQMPKISPYGKKVAFGGSSNNEIFITDYFGEKQSN